MFLCSYKIGRLHFVADLLVLGMTTYDVIDLESGVAPIARAPYRMTHLEMKELKEQISAIVWSRIYQEEHIVLGSSSPICKEKR